MKLNQPYRWLLLYVTLWAIWLTGIAWVVVHYFMREKGKFGFKTNPWEGWWLMAHGGVAVLTTFLFGWMWSRHVVTGWDLHWRRRSGGTIAGTTIFLILSGYALLYRRSGLAGLDGDRPLGHRHRRLGAVLHPLAVEVAAAQSYQISGINLWRTRLVYSM